MAWELYEQRIRTETAVDRQVVKKAEDSESFHKTISGYSPTPLWALPGLAKKLRIEKICVKDECFRWGLKAFKGLGASYSMARYVGDCLHIPPEQLSMERLQWPDARKILQNTTFVTATDGNHGRGVAWAAQLFGSRSVVYMPKGSSEERLQAIRSYGAEAEITDMDYDDTVRFAKKQADIHGWILLQDTSWPGYEKIPAYIMHGYTTMALEAVRQWGEDAPTHVFLQAGVGAMAGAVAEFLKAYYKEQKPIICIVEPEEADCIHQTAVAKDGQLHHADGHLQTLMAGLACGEPCHLGWNKLKDTAEYYATVPDEVAVKGMQTLACPCPGDPAIVSGESGAVTTGFLCETALDEAWREKLRLTDTSRVLLFSTEGDTSPEVYRKILRDSFGCYRDK